MTGRLAILGGGKIGEALLSGLLRGGTLHIDDVVVVEKHEPRAVELRDKYGVATLDVASAAAHADTILIAVKPQDIDALLAELHDLVGPRPRRRLGRGRDHDRAHRARAARARRPSCAACPTRRPWSTRRSPRSAPGTTPTTAHLAVADALLSAVGRVVHVPEVTAGRGDGIVGQRARLLLLPGRGDDRRRASCSGCRGRWPRS